MMEYADAPRPDTLDDENDQTGAPIFDVPDRKMVAIEHPCVVINLDKGLATFGPEPDFQKLLVNTADPSSVPLWFRPDNPTSKPIVSHLAPTNNILLKITVPKRTGRKRKRGSNEPFIGDIHVSEGVAITSGADEVSSMSRRDLPKSILRKMRDNLDDYQIEAVGSVQGTHRYRGLADFQFANTSSSFLTNIAEHLLPLQVSKLREIRFAPGVAAGPGQEIIPPPHFTDKVIGFNYNYEQNPNIKVEGKEGEDGRLINIQGRKKHSYGHFINHNQYPVPTKARREPTIEIPDGLLKQLHALMEERPIWTRRAILNSVTGNYADSMLRIALQLVGYQFRGGPWRDAFVKYGVDPRPDPKFRIYQTLAFKLERNIVGTKKVPWELVRKDQVKKPKTENTESHLWDGEQYSTDGKFWQVCDITDPFVRQLIDQAPLRDDCDLNDSGWYYRGTWAKVKMIMKVKMIAIKRGRMGSDDDNPQKAGLLYNSFLKDRIRQWPDKVEKSLGLTIEPFLRPIEEVDTRVRRRRPNPTQAQGKQDGATATETIGRPGDDDLTNEDSDAIVGNDDEAPDNEETPLRNIPWDEDDVIDSLDDEDREVEDDDEYGDYYSDEGGYGEDEDGEVYDEDNIELEYDDAT
ncbi:hypothetical protein F4820DRAFT_412535 [Hypoxylon rubiginosum]|uniref:Uncharacterized protein n=1 Tax=Hypoxylon rubiginosum TaxID=110542 RepID=A0ACB9Z7H9_9PEZI|nr:hypothetical protein F4820DRAFT_412535 [Hypoxylon rubiginosum]